MKEASGPSREIPPAALALRPRIEGVCLRILRHRTDAEDAVQTVYRIFLEKAPAAEGGKLEAWLLRTATLVCRNERRARARRARRPGPVDAPEKPGIPELPCPGLRDALAALPSRLREAVTLRYLRERSIPETAAALGCPPRTLEKRLQRGLELLRRFLVRKGGPSLPAALAAALGGGRAEAFARAAAPWVGAAGILLLAGAAAVRFGRPESGSEPAPAPFLATAEVRSRAARTTPSPLRPSLAAALNTRAAAHPFPSSFPDFVRGFLELRKEPRVLARWQAVGIDASAAVLLREVPEENPDAIFPAVFEEWTRRDGLAAAEWFRATYDMLPDDWTPEIASSWSDRLYPGAAVLRQWLEQAPADARSWIAGQPGGRARDWLTAHLLAAESAGPKAPHEELVRRLDRLPWDAVKLRTLTLLVKDWGASDPKAAADWIWSRRRKPAWELPVTEVSAQTSDRGVPDALPLLARRDRMSSSGHESLAESAAFGGILGGWTKRDPEEAWRWCWSRPAGPRADNLIDLFVGHLVVHDPRAALDYTQRIPDPEVQARWRFHAAVEIAEMDVGAAFAVAEVLPAGDERDMAFSDILSRAESFPATAAWIDHLASKGLADDRLLRKLAGDFVERWAAQDPRASAEWILGRPESQGRDALLRRLGPVWAGSDPAGFAAHATAFGGSSDWGPVFASGAARLWGKDREAAHGLAARLGPGPWRREVQAAIAGAWGEYDPNASGAWALRLHDPADRDAALLGLIAELAEQKDGLPEARFWLTCLGDEDARAKAQEMLR